LAVEISVYPEGNASGWYWMLFQTVTEEFLSSIGARYEESEILRGLDATEDWYVGDGWYTDGADRRVDHYNAWAFHFYPLLWTI